MPEFSQVEAGSSPIDLWCLRNLIIVNDPIYVPPSRHNPSSISPSSVLAENCTFVSTAWRSNNDNSRNSCFPVFPSREPVDDGIESEICVSSSSNDSGCLGHPFLTQDIFNSRLCNKVSRCYVLSGNRGIVKGEERFLFVTGRCPEVIKLPNGQDIHHHYIETAAYSSCPQFIRGVCLIVLVTEKQSGNENKILRNICERIRENVFKDEKVDIGSVPKTTSGKIQRWLAKDNFLGGKMNVLMEIKSDNNGGLLQSSHGVGQRRGRRKSTGS